MGGDMPPMGGDMMPPGDWPMPGTEGGDMMPPGDWPMPGAAGGWEGDGGWEDGMSGEWDRTDGQMGEMGREWGEMGRDPLEMWLVGNCTMDGDCDGTKKCCGSFHRQCTEPIGKLHFKSKGFVLIDQVEIGVQHNHTIHIFILFLHNVDDF